MRLCDVYSYIVGRHMFVFICIYGVRLISKYDIAKLIEFFKRTTMHCIYKQKDILGVYRLSYVSSDKVMTLCCFPPINLINLIKIGLCVLKIL